MDKVQIIFNKNSGLFCPSDGKTIGGYIKVEYDDGTFEQSDNFWHPEDGYSSGTFEYQADLKVVTFRAHQFGIPLWTYYISRGKSIPKEQVTSEQQSWHSIYERIKNK